MYAAAVGGAVGGQGQLELTGGTGVYVGLAGRCTYETEYLANNQVITTTDCTGTGSDSGEPTQPCRKALARARTCTGAANLRRFAADNPCGGGGHGRGDANPVDR